MNKVDLAVLGFLIRMPMHGYQIAEFFEKRGIEFWIKIKMPSVYKALGRLEEKAHITGKLEIDDCNRARKVYSITDSGRAYFHELLDEIFFCEKFTSPFDFWNAFRFLDGNISKDYFVKLVKHRKKKEEEHHCKMEEKRLMKENQFDANQIPFYLKMLFEHLQSVHQQQSKLLDKLLLAAESPENSKVFNINKNEELK
ncbi:MAG: PadR family transcriptional regulator [Candidatus Cloacimonetes bacterium]|nr:PadR family transcriptional regulator [Candidatus Cloacimonadota bacterium]